MAAMHNHVGAKRKVSSPSSLGELFSLWEKYPQSVIYAGGTAIISCSAKPVADLPQNILCLGRLKNLVHITRTERYLEIGSMVKLNQIIRLGKIVPEVFMQCLENIGTLQLRNLATIGGNIYSGRGDAAHGEAAARGDAACVLAALDAQFELRKPHSSRWMLAGRFFSLPPAAREPGELLTRIRVPLENWDYSVYRKLNGYAEKHSRALAFMVKTQKNILSDIRVVCKSAAVLRDKNIEALLIGKKLPLSLKIAGDFVERWETLLNSFTQEGQGDLNPPAFDVSKRELANCIALAVRDLCG